MGDRVNVAFRTDSDSYVHVWLYSHSCGHEMPAMLLAAMKTRAAQSRLNDASYLCRILLDRLITNHTEETGYGISTSIGDNEYPVIEVDIPAEMIRVRPFDFGEAWEVKWVEPPLFQQSFAEFIKRDSFDWDAAKGVSV